jgi:hypothetical protein
MPGVSAKSLADSILLIRSKGSAPLAYHEPPERVGHQLAFNEFSADFGLASNQDG